MADETDGYAGRIVDLLRQALEHCQGTHSLADVQRELEARRLDLWITASARAVAVTELVQYPSGRVLNVFLSAGDRCALAEGLPGLEAYARGKGAVAVMFYGRAPRKAAWAELLPGFRPAWICMWKDL